MKDLMNMNTNKEPTMSSREIAELTGKEHRNVVRDIKKMFEDLEIDVLKCERIFLDSMNRKQTEYLLNRELTDCLLTGYSAKLRMVVIKRWHELESKESKPTFRIPTTLSGALLLAGEIEKERERLEVENLEQKEQLTLAAPKVNHYDTVVERSNLVNATQVSTKVGISAQALNKHLDLLGVYNKNVLRGRTFRRWFISEGYGQVKQTANGYTQSLFTMKGEAWVINQLSPVKSTCLLTITNR